MKQSNDCGAKELAVMRRSERDTSSVLRGEEKMSTRLSLLTLRAKENPKCKFTSLAYIMTEDFLKECFKELQRDKAPGIDGITVKEYEVNIDENIKELVERMKTWKYRPKPVRRVYIPKSNGERRGLGIPTVEDKIVQMGINKILEAIYKVDFIDVSYGFRTNRNAHQALVVLDGVIMTKPVNYIVDMDIEKFFDTVDHKWLMKCLKQRIVDPSILRLIGRFLNAGIIEEGKLIETDKGTPQGSILSPMLANIYLHYILDLWFEKIIKPRFIGYVKLIRYADDFIVCFQNGDEARKFSEMLKQRFSKFGLKISEEKSRIIEFGRNKWQRAQGENKDVATFEFLGFTHYCDKSRKGKFKLGRKTAEEKFKKKEREMNEWLKKVRNIVKAEEWWKTLRQKLIGHYNYYGISGNLQSIKMFYKRTIELTYKWINKRSQKKSYNWEQFNRYIKYNPLPEPRIYHVTYVLSL